MSTAAQTHSGNQLLFSGYEPGSFYDELIAPNGQPRPCAVAMYDNLANMPLDVFDERRKLADLSYLVQGITFTVYSDGRGTERLFPFDLVPRIIPRSEWDVIERGLAQRVKAINLYLQDIYGTQRVLKDKIIPRNLVYSCKHFRREMVGLNVPRDIYVHISGIDLVRDSRTGQYLVLEDNARSPSGISYVLENRLVMRRTFPRVFELSEVLPVDHYPAELVEILRSLSPRPSDRPVIVLLTPGLYNSAYFEHSFLAQQMGIELVEGRDLVVVDDCVYMKTIHGLTRVDVIYRRVDDDFLDPLAFRADSLVGVPGLMNAYRAGNIALANAVGTGVADDKAIYAYVPRLHPLLPRRRPHPANVDTYLCSRARSTRLRAGTPSRTGRQGGGRIRRLRHADGPFVRQATPSKTSANAHGRSAQLHRPARHPTLPRALLRSTPSDHVAAATSTSVPTASTTAKDSRIVPGGLTRVLSSAAPS